MKTDPFGPDEGAIVDPLTARVAALASTAGVAIPPDADPDPIVKALLAAHERLEGITAALEARERAVAVREAKAMALERSLAACQDLRPILSTKPARVWSWRG
jgi:hypothetical protein